MRARESRVFHVLQIAAHRMQKRADEEIGGACALTTSQAAVLSALKERPGSAQKDIAQALGLNSSALTAMLGRLLRLGYAVREKDESDARAWRLSISPTGAEILAAAGPPFDKVNALIEKTLSPEEIAQLADMAARLSATFAAEALNTGDEGKPRPLQPSIAALRRS